jgi:catechol 2,3-dioxygenase-like lactoylglutathione lyase family enzyme
MTGTAQAIRITHVGTLFVPVADQERALAFYVDKLGFEKRADFPYGEGSRWIEVAPEGSAIAVALVPPGEGRTTGSDEARCALASEDIEADHASLRAAGVDVDAEIARAGRRRAGLVSLDATIADPMPPQFCFRDTEGNRFLVVGVT